MSGTQTPPLPAGFKPAQNNSTVPPLPSGFKLAPPAAPQSQQQPPADPHADFDLQTQPVHEMSGWDVAKDAVNDVAGFVPAMNRGVFKEGGKTLLGLDNLIRKGLNHMGGHYAELDESDFGGKKGDLDTKGVGETIGGVAENVGEFFTGEELLGMIGKAAKSAEALKGAAQLSSMLAKYPRIAKLLHIGLSATKQAAIAGTQTAVKTGGDMDAAGEAALVTGGTGAVLEGAAPLVKGAIRKVMPSVEKIGSKEVVVPAAVRNAKPTAVQEAGQQVYRETAQEAARPALEEINAAREPRTVQVTNPEPNVNPNTNRVKQELGSTASTVPESMLPKGAQPSTASTKAANEIGSAAATVPDSVLGPKSPAAAPKNLVTEIPPAKPKINIGQHLDNVHDFTSAADVLHEQASEIYDRIDKASGGQFKEAKEALKAAQKKMWSTNSTQAAADVAEAKGKIETILNDMKGTTSPEEVNAARTAFRREYVLRDVANALDSSWSGIPGSSARGNAYRGFDGNRLMGGLQRLARQMGRGQLEQTLGKARLENLERIAELNRTGANRQKFGAAVDHVATWLQQHGMRHVSWPVIGGALGEMSGHGWAVGATAGEMSYLATRKVMNAITANPKLGQFLTYAIDSGANPERYGPMLGTMISEYEQSEHEDNKNAE